MALTLRSKDGCAPNDKLSKMFDKLMSFGAAKKLTSNTSNTTEYDAYHERETWQKLKTERDKDLVLMFGEDDVRIFYRGRHDENRQVALQSVKMDDNMSSVMRQAGLGGAVGVGGRNRRRGRLEAHLARAHATDGGDDTDNAGTRGGGNDGTKTNVETLLERGEDEDGPLNSIGEEWWKKWIVKPQEESNTEQRRKAKRRRRHHRRGCKYHPFSTNADFRKLSLQTSFPKKVILDSVGRVQHAANGSVSGELDETPMDNYFAAPDLVQNSIKTPPSPSNQMRPPLAQGPGSNKHKKNHHAHFLLAEDTQPEESTTNPPTPGDAASEVDMESVKSTEIDTPSNTHPTTTQPAHRGRSMSNMSNHSNRSEAATASSRPGGSGSRTQSRKNSVTTASRTTTTAATPILDSPARSATPIVHEGTHQSPGADSLNKIPEAMSTVFLTEASGEHSPLLPHSSAITMNQRCGTPSLDQFTKPLHVHSYVAPRDFCDCDCSDRSTDDEGSSDDERVRPIVGTADRAHRKVMLFQRHFALANIHAISSLNSILEERAEERDLACNDRRHLNIITEEAEKCGADWRVSRRQRSTTPAQGSVWKSVHVAIGDDRKHTARNRDHYTSFVDNCAKIGFPENSDQLKLVEDFRDICLRSSKKQQRLTKVLPVNNASPQSRSNSPGVGAWSSSNSRPASRNVSSRQSVRQLRQGNMAASRASTPGLHRNRTGKEASSPLPHRSATPTAEMSSGPTEGLSANTPSIFHAPLHGKGSRVGTPSFLGGRPRPTSSASTGSMLSTQLGGGMGGPDSTLESGLQMTTLPMEEDVMTSQTFFRLLEKHGHHMVRTKVGVNALDLIRELCGVGTKEFLSAVYAKEHVWPLGAEMHQLHKRLMASRSTFMQRDGTGSNLGSAVPTPSSFAVNRQSSSGAL